MFSAGDIVRVKTAFLPLLKRRTKTQLRTQTLESLGSLSTSVCRIVSIDMFVINDIQLVVQVVPVDSQHPRFNNGLGVRIYFESNEDFENSFEFAAAFVDQLQDELVVNTSGVTIPRGSVCRLTGFSSTLHLPEVAMSNASLATTAFVLGLANSDIENGSVGSLTVVGPFSQIDTSAFSSVNDLVYLANSDGAISTSPGTSSVLVGRVTSISATAGSIAVYGVFEGPSGGSSGLPTLAGTQFATLMEDPVGTLVFQRITEDMILPSFAVTLNGGGLVDVGDTVTTPGFTASYTRTPTAAIFTDNAGTPAQDVIGTPNSFSSTGTFVRNTHGASVTFTLTADEGGPSANDTASLTWVNRVFFGVGAAGGNSETFIEALASSALATSRSRTFNVTAGASEKIYYAYRDAFGDATFTVGGFEGGFALVSNTISVTNSFGFTENYRLYESDNLGLGNTTVVVS